MKSNFISLNKSYGQILKNLLRFQLGFAAYLSFPVLAKTAINITPIKMIIAATITIRISGFIALFAVNAVGCLVCAC